MSLPASQRPIGKPLVVAIIAILLAPAEPWLLNLTAQLDTLFIWLNRTAFPVFIATAMNPKHMAESGYGITRPEFFD